jgi:26S proteasome regulatory subunit N4
VHFFLCTFSKQEKKTRLQRHLTYCMTEVADTVDRVAELKAQIADASQKRAATEAAVTDAMMLLEATPVGLHGALVDEEGFPRADVDLYAVRTARHTVATGKNDLSALEDTLHELLGELHECTTETSKRQMDEDDAMRAQRKRETEALQRRQQQIATMRRKTPFLVVDDVASGSPAAHAGMCPGDIVIALGKFEAEGFATSGLRGLSMEVALNEGLVMTVWVIRSEGNYKETLELPLVPQRWRGDGLVGCRFAPL